jgi:hypothetical protein
MEQEKKGTIFLGERVVNTGLQKDEKLFNYKNKNMLVI